MVYYLSVGIGKIYVLRGHEVVESENFAELGRLYGENFANRVVRKTDWPGNAQFEACEISTVFLGIDHGFREGPPIVFETMVFGGPLDEWQRRYATWDQAVAGHEETLDLVRQAYRGEPVELEEGAKLYVRRSWHERIIEDDDLG